LNEEKQFKLLQEFQKYYNDLPFPEQKTQDCRYYYDQDLFCYADAIFLYCFLRKNNPRKIVEVGAGFSSAVILDTVERFIPQQPEIIFIEPSPDRLKSLLKPCDKGQTRIFDRKVQEMPMEFFTSLESGDLLFIDSSHVMKAGSDVQFLMFEVLPHLAPGVFVHFHDVFYPFEYPSYWLLEGISWNEDYLIRAFLAYNSAWTIHFFNPYVAIAFEEYMREKMPLCLKDTGGSIYIQKGEQGP
jgi:predicted O-methyltransferase YrrM